MTAPQTFSGLFGHYIMALDIAVVAQDPVANTTRISYNYYATRQTTAANGAWTALHNVSFSVVVNGTTIASGTPNFDFRTASAISFLNGEYTISNASNGSLSLTVSATTNGLATTHFLASTIGGTFGAPVVNRASDFSVTPSPVLQGTNVDIEIIRLNPSYTHNITWAGAGSSGTIAIGVATSETWTTPTGLLGGASSVSIQLTVETFLSGTSIGKTVHDLILRDVYTYPTVGQGTPYDIRFNRLQIEGSNWVAKETIPFTTANFTDTSSATGTCTIAVPTTIYDTDLDFEVVLLEVFDGAQWIDTGLLFSLGRVEGDIVDPTGVITYTGTAYVDYVLGKAVSGADQTWASNTPGDILSQEITAAKTRGWGPWIGYDFTAAATSEGTPWANPEVGLDIPASQPYSQILSGFVGDATAEYTVSFHDNKAWLSVHNPGYGRDWTVAASDPVVNFKTAGVGKVISTVPIKKDYSGILTRVTVNGDSVSATRERADLVDPRYGMLEGSVDASGVTDPTKLNTMGDDSIISASTPSVERTFDYNLSSTETSTALYPYRTFRPGDWVFVPGDNGTTIRQRVSQVAITRDDTGTTATITIGDLIPSGVAALARKQTQASGGAIPGGTLNAPDPLAAQVPNAPTSLTATPVGYWDSVGIAKGSVDVTWDAVNTATTGATIAVDLYELWTRPELGDPWVLAAQSDDLDVTLDPFALGQTFDLKVRARNVNSVNGVYSEYVTVTIPAPTDLVPAPSDPVLTADAIGNVGIAWDGKIASATPPLWFAYLRADISIDGTTGWSPAGQQLTSAGATNVPLVGAGVWYFRFVGVDELGRDGAPSTVVSVTVTPVIADARVPKVPTSLALVSAGYWADAEPQANVSLTWDAVTEATDGTTMTIRSYEVWGRLEPNTVPILLGSTLTNSAVIEDVAPIGSTWDFKVRAFGANTVPGGFTAEQSQVIAAAPLTLDPPTTPTLSSGRGVILVSWDGNLYNATTNTAYAAPNYLSSVDVWVSTDGGSTYTRQGFLTQGARTISVAALGVGSTAVIELTATDALGQTTAASATASIVVSGINGADIVANTISGNDIQVGTIEVDRVSPSFGQDLNLAANGMITLLVGNDTVQTSANATTAANLAALRTRYDFTSSAAIISQPGSTFQISISNAELDFLEAGVVRAYLNAGVFNAPKLAANELVFPKHIFEDDPAGTIIKRF